MSELIPRGKSPSGRRRAVTARAWITRPQRLGNYHSHVYLGGDGRVKVLSTATADRRKALEFNRCHLLHLLAMSPAPAAKTEQHQSELIEYFGASPSLNHQLKCPNP